MPLVLGIDPSLTSTGLALLGCDSSGLAEHELRRVRSKPSGNDWASRRRRIEAIVTTVGASLPPLVKQRVDLAVMESPSYSSASTSTHDRAKLWWDLYDMLSDRGIRVITAAPTQRMKYVTGKGRADKDVVLAHTIRRFPQLDITGNDVADAVVFAAIGARELGFPIDNVPTVNQSVMSKLGR